MDDGIALVQDTVEAIRILVELLGKAHPCKYCDHDGVKHDARDIFGYGGVQGSTLGKLGARAAGLQGAHQAW